MQFFFERTLLLERLTGITLFLSVLAFVCNGIVVSRPRSTRFWLLGYAVALGFMGLIYLPAESADLVRLQELMADWANHDFEWLLNQMRLTSTPVYMLYFWIVGQLHIKSMLPAITAFVHYLLIFSCIWDYARRNSCSQESVGLALLMYMAIGSFVSTISGIRSYLAFAMIARAVYLEWSRNRLPIVTAPYYLLAIGMHPAAALLAILRFIMLPFERRSGKYSFYFSIVCTLFIVFVLSLVAAPMIIGVITAAKSYGPNSSSYFNIWETAIHLLATIFILYTLTKIDKYCYADDCFILNSKKFVIVIAVFSLVFLPIEYAVFSRFSTFAFIVSIPIILRVLTSRDDNYRQVLILITVLIAALSCTRGDLTAYKFFII